MDFARQKGSWFYISEAVDAVYSDVIKNMDQKQRKTCYTKIAIHCRELYDFGWLERRQQDGPGSRRFCVQYKQAQLEE